MRVPAEQIRQQLVSVLRAWGMSDAHADTTAEMMLETDLRGVDSHGISMLPTYDHEFRAGRLNMRPQFKTVREGPAMALIDADASLGHPVSVYAMNLAIDKCREIGVAVVSVFNSHHFGAAGCYSRIAADRGVIGMVTSATRGVTMVPTFGAEPIMGTNPLAFAAPAGATRHSSSTWRRRRSRPARSRSTSSTTSRCPPAGSSTATGNRSPTRRRASLTSSSEPDGGITPLGGTARAGRPQGLRAGGDGAHPRRHAGRRLVLAAPQPDAEAVGSAQHRPLLHGHRPARVPRRRASSRRISTR